MITPNGNSRTPTRRCDTSLFLFLFLKKKGQWQRDSQLLLWSIPCPYFGQAHNLETAKQSPFRALRQVKTRTEPTGTKRPQNLGKAISHSSSLQQRVQANLRLEINTNAPSFCS